MAELVGDTADNQRPETPLPTEFIYDQPALLIGATMLIFLAIATELRFRAGRCAKSRSPIMSPKS